MNNVINVTVRVFPVTIMDVRTGTESTDSIVLTRAQLQAAQIVGQSSKELIARLYTRQGYRVTDIGKPVKRTILVDLYLDHSAGIVAEGYTKVDQEAVR